MPGLRGAWRAQRTQALRAVCRLGDQKRFAKRPGSEIPRKFRRNPVGMAFRSHTSGGVASVRPLVAITSYSLVAPRGPSIGKFYIAVCSICWILYKPETDIRQGDQAARRLVPNLEANRPQSTARAGLRQRSPGSADVSPLKQLRNRRYRRWASGQDPCRWRTIATLWHIE